MRVNLDEKAKNDPRFRRLARSLNLQLVDFAVGAVALGPWMAAMNRVDEGNPVGLLSVDDAEDSTDLRGLIEAMIACGLAEVRADGLLYFAGIEERARFILTQKAKGRLGGRPRKAGGEGGGNGSSPHGLKKAPAFPEKVPEKKPGLPSAPVNGKPGVSAESPGFHSDGVSESLTSGSGSCSGSKISGAPAIPAVRDPDSDHPVSVSSSGWPPDAPVLSLVEPKTAKPAKSALSARARAEAASWLEWFNRRFGRNFTLRDEVVKQVAALLAKGFSQDDMRLVALGKRALWEDDTKMRDYLVPASILRLDGFGGYLDQAHEMARTAPTEGKRHG